MARWAVLGPAWPGIKTPMAGRDGCIQLYHIYEKRYRTDVFKGYANGAKMGHIDIGIPEN